MTEQVKPDQQVRVDRDVMVDIANVIAQQQGIGLLLAEGREKAFTAKSNISRTDANAVDTLCAGARILPSCNISRTDANAVDTVIEGSEKYKTLMTIHSEHEQKGHVDVVESVFKRDGKIVGSSTASFVVSPKLRLEPNDYAGNMTVDVIDAVGKNMFSLETMVLAGGSITSYSIQDYDQRHLGGTVSLANMVGRQIQINLGYADRTYGSECKAVTKSGLNPVDRTRVEDTIETTCNKK
jgi:hypothetical protein